LSRWCFVAAALLLSGCAGTDFVRPDDSLLVNGRTTYAQIVARMGMPTREGTVLKNEKTIDTASYAYANVGGKALHEGVTPARAITFYFVGGMLVGREFVSSFAEDHSDFDENRVKDIIKGKTTRAELMQLFGKPGGYYIHPMIKSEKGEAAVYVFSETRGSAFNLKFFRKTLVVTFDAAGVASDVDFSSSGSR
jgi:hypothetical protein